MSAKSYTIITAPACETPTVSHVRVVRPKHVTMHTGSMACESHMPKKCHHAHGSISCESHMAKKYYHEHRKKMEVNWDRLDPRLQCVDGLDDIMRFDLQHFCRRMQPPEEPHYRSTQQSSMSHLVLDHFVGCHVMSCHSTCVKLHTCHHGSEQTR